MLNKLMLDKYIIIINYNYYYKIIIKNNIK